MFFSILKICLNSKCCPPQCKREKMFFRMLLLLGLYGLGLHAIEVNLCDCSASAEKGILQFSDENCFSEPNPNKTNEVKYEVYTEKREGI